MNRTAQRQPDDSDEDDSVPIIEISPDRQQILDLVVGELGKVKGLYQRAGELSRVWLPPLGEVSRLPQIRPLRDAKLGAILTTIAEFVRTDERSKQETREHPPDWLIRGVLENLDYPTVPVLRSIVGIPVLRPDGTILQTPGYDGESYLLYHPTEEFRREFVEIPEKPTAQEIQAALTLLTDLIAQFPFETSADISSYLAGMLTPFTRYSFVGPVPLFAVIANSPGVGKTKLVDMASLIFNGNPAARQSYTEDEDEWRKRINRIAAKGSTICLWDDIKKKFGNGVLDAALTAVIWGEREVGSKDAPEYPLLWVPWITGNGLQMKADTYMRSVPIRLKTNLEKPQNRTDLKDKRIEETVMRQRAQYIRACLTILRGYQVHGKSENINIPDWHRFPAWSEAVRKPLVWLKLPDPYETHIRDTEEADSTVAAVRGLVLGWEELLQVNGVLEMTTRDAYRHMLEYLEFSHTDAGRGQQLTCDQLITTLQELCPRRRGELPEPGQIGLLLSSYEGRIINGLRIRSEKRTSAGNAWGIEKVNA